MAKIPQTKTLRVISGIYKGRALQIPCSEVTRASKAILKESLFNTLNTDILGVDFVEFFAGSGSIGIEALSRGARFALFFERNKESFAKLSFNVQQICKDSTYKLLLGDTFCLYKKALKSLQSPCIAYIDPPFSIRENMQEIYTKCFALMESLDPTLFKRLILEHQSKLVIPQNIGAFSLIKTRQFGRSALSYFA